MKKLVLFLLFGFSLITFNGCNGSIVPIIQDVCEVTTQICDYANLLCSQFQPGLLSEEEEQNLLIELNKVKDILEARAKQINLDSEAKKNFKDNYRFYVDRLNESVNDLNIILDKNKIETVNN